MTEQRLKSIVVRNIKREFPSVWSFKCSDRFISGIPDIIGCLNGRFFAIELKTVSGKLSKIQEHVKRLIERSGGAYAVCRSWEEALNFLIEIDVQVGPLQRIQTQIKLERG